MRSLVTTGPKTVPGLLLSIAPSHLGLQQKSAFLPSCPCSFPSRFIEVLGLKTLFAAFMKKGAKAMKKSYKENFSETEEEGKENHRTDTEEAQHLRPKS